MPVMHVLFISVFLIVSGWLPGAVGAAERDRPIRIGALSASWGPTPHVVGLREGLVELGYRENKDFVIGVQFTQGDTLALPVAAGELVKQGADIIFAAGISAASAAKSASDQVPMVFAGSGDPVARGLIQSFARPGGNITGVTNLDLSAKRLEIFQEMIPGLNRVLFPHDPNRIYSVTELRVYREAARRLGIVLVEKAVRTEEEARATLAQVRKGEEVDGIVAPRGTSLNISGFILEATSKRAIPTMFRSPFWVERGALASYGPDNYESGRQAARLVDKILKGANPAEIPVEVNTKIKFVINLKVAKALGLKIKPEVLYRADQLVR